MLIFNELKILQIERIGFFRTADYADETDFSQIYFFGMHPSTNPFDKLREQSAWIFTDLAGEAKKFTRNLLYYFLRIYCFSQTEFA